MSIGFIFWLLMLLWLVFGIWSFRGAPANPALWPYAGGSVLIFVLLFLLGWKTFGWPIAG